MVRRLADASIRLHDKCVVVLASCHLRRMETLSDLEAFNGTDRADYLCQVRIKFIKNRFTKPCRKTGNHAFHDTASRIFLRHLPFQILLCLCGCGSIRHIQLILFTFCQIKPIRRHFHRSDRFRVCFYPNVQGFQQLCRDSACCHASDRLASRRTSAAPVIPETVFFIEGIICMSGTVITGDLTVILRMLILVPHQHRDRRARRPPFKNA